MATLVLHAALAASLLGSSSARDPRVVAHEACVPATTDISSWPIVRSPRVPGLTLRLPRSFERDSGASTEPARSGITARWTQAAGGQLVISRGAVPSAALAASAGAPSYNRCEERVGSAVAVIESVDRGTEGQSAFRLQARLRWPDGEEILVVGDAADRERFAELLAAVRTIRRTSA
jgi:hypothetical protein